MSVPSELVVPRRERLRMETTAEIKRRSWELMARSGPDALSLRAVARQMGMAPSALYRYFASRDDLLTALIVDGFDSLAGTLGRIYAAESAGDPRPDACDMFVLVAIEYRRWAFEHPTEFALIFSTTIPDYNGTPETTAAAKRSSDVLLRIMVDLVEEGRLATERIDDGLTPALRRRLAEWSAHGGMDLPPAALAAAMWCYAALHGAIHLDSNGHLPQPLQGQLDMFESITRAVLDSITNP